MDDKQYGVPFNLGMVGVWYNKSLFEKAGINAPPSTWSEFLADVEKLKSAGITPIAVGEGQVAGDVLVGQPRCASPAPTR